jgi:hypothetical protein
VFIPGPSAPGFESHSPIEEFLNQVNSLDLTLSLDSPIFASTRINSSPPYTVGGKRGEWCAVPRFTDNGDGTVTDNMTGLIWLEDTNCPGGTIDWSAGLTFASPLYDGSTGDSGGDCGLSDGSVAALRT